jgi:5-methylcytosine-specific restriction endonuclease McrA
MPFRPCVEARCPLMAQPGKARCREHQAVLERHRWLRNPNRDNGYRRAKRQVAKLLPIPCSLCGNPITHLGHDRWSLTFDHIVSVADGGSNDLANLRPAHKSCNSSRGRGR